MDWDQKSGPTTRGTKGTEGTLVVSTIITSFFLHVTHPPPLRREKSHFQFLCQSGARAPARHPEGLGGGLSNGALFRGGPARALYPPRPSLWNFGSPSHNVVGARCPDTRRCSRVRTRPRPPAQHRPHLMPGWDVWAVCQSALIELEVRSRRRSTGLLARPATRASASCATPPQRTDTGPCRPQDPHQATAYLSRGEAGRGGGGAA